MSKLNVLISNLTQFFESCKRMYTLTNTLMKMFQNTSFKNRNALVLK